MPEFAYDIPHYDPQQDETVYLDSDDFMEQAADEFLGGSDEADMILLRDVAQWINDGEEISVGNRGHLDPFLGYSGRAVTLAKLLRDNDVEFRKWREQKWNSRIERRAKELAIEAYENREEEIPE